MSVQKKHNKIQGFISPTLKNPWKKILIILLLLAEIVAIFYIYKVTFAPKIIDDNMKISSNSPIGEITSNVIVVQTLQADTNTAGISLLLGTYGRSNTSHYDIQIYDQTNDACVFSKTIEAVDVKENKYSYFEFTNQEYNDEERQLEISITSKDANSGNAITIWSSATDEYKDGELYINGQKMDGDLVFSKFCIDTSNLSIGLFFNRVILIVLLIFFILLHLVLDISKMYDWIFRNRVWIAAALVLFCVMNQYNFSSIAIYDDFFQTGQGSEYIEPIFGNARSIRSDEWLVSTPAKLSAQYSDYSKYNTILGAETTSNLSLSGLYCGYSGLANPLGWGYYLLGASYGTSFYWAVFFVLTFLVSFEMCLIISNRKRLVSLMGAVLIAFSGYNLWWSGVLWILSGQAAIVSIYYFIRADKKYKKALWSVGIALAGACFIANLYPAWQVPAGFLYLGILIWMLITERKTIRKFDKFDWGIMGLSMAFLTSIVVVFLLDSQEYMKSIMNTVYPGNRVSYGGFKIDKLFNYLEVLIYPFRGLDNQSEAGVFLNFFPVPMVLTIVLLIKKKGKDILSLILLSISMLLIVYCTIELPPFLAKILLLTYSTPYRAVDIVGFIQVYLLVAALSRFEGIKKINSVVAWIIGLATMVVAVYFCNKTYPGYLQNTELVIMAFIFLIICVLFLTDINRKLQTTLMIGIICISIVSGICINPIVKGLDVIYSKPIAKEIMSIVATDSDAKWITLDNRVDSGFLVSCGAPTINSVNNIPNYSMWKILDPAGEYSEVYNRYAHISINLVEKSTNASLFTFDYLVMSLAYKDMEKIGVKYIFCRHTLEANETVTFIKLYEESNCYIYEANYQ